MNGPDMTHGKTCICTVSSDGFVAATLVTLASFRRHNPDFGDDVVVFDGGLSADSRDQLLQAMPDVIVEPESAQLTGQLQTLLVAHPVLAGRRARFLSLEAFRLTGYDRILFLDSDLLVQRSMQHMLTLEQGFQAVADGCHLACGVRHPQTFEQIRPGEPVPENALRRTFNSGVMMIRPDLLPADIHQTLLTKLSPDFWDTVTAGHTDQVVLNVCLQDRVILADVSNNYLMMHRALFRQVADLNPVDAAVLHFNGPFKPWLADRMLPAVRHDPTIIRARQLWQDEFQRLLQDLALNPPKRGTSGD